MPADGFPPGCANASAVSTSPAPFLYFPARPPANVNSCGASALASAAWAFCLAARAESSHSALKRRCSAWWESTWAIRNLAARFFPARLNPHKAPRSHAARLLPGRAKCLQSRRAVSRHFPVNAAPSIGIFFSGAGYTFRRPPAISPSLCSRTPAHALIATATQTFVSAGTLPGSAMTTASPTPTPFPDSSVTVPARSPCLAQFLIPT